MHTDASFFVKLVGMSTFLEHQADLEDSLNEFATMAANLLDTENCSIMLFREGDDPSDFRLRIFAKTGFLPENALQEAAKVKEGIAGQVAASGQPLLVEDITQSPYFPLARRPDGASKCFISVPVLIGNKVVGVINVSKPRDGRCFGTHDLDIASFVALLVGKSIQVVQLQSLLRSRFAQMAFSRETKDLVANRVTELYQDPARLSKVAAKTFYREMTRAGLGTEHILKAATEIVGLLNDNLKKHRRRFTTPKPEETAST